MNVVVSLEKKFFPGASVDCVDHFCCFEKLGFLCVSDYTNLHIYDFGTMKLIKSFDFSNIDFRTKCGLEIGRIREIIEIVKITENELLICLGSSEWVILKFPSLSCKKLFSCDFSIGRCEVFSTYDEKNKKLMRLKSVKVGHSKYQLGLIIVDISVTPFSCKEINFVKEFKSKVECFEDSKITKCQLYNCIYLNTYNAEGDDIMFLYDYMNEKEVMRHTILASKKRVEIYSTSSYLRNKNEEIFVCGGMDCTIYFFNIKSTKYFRKVNADMLNSPVSKYNLDNIMNINNQYLFCFAMKDTSNTVIFDLTENKFIFVGEVDIYPYGKNRIELLSATKESVKMLVENSESYSMSYYSITGLNITTVSEQEMQDLLERVDYFKNNVDDFFPEDKSFQFQSINIHFQKKKFKLVPKILLNL